MKGIILGLMMMFSIGGLSQDRTHDVIIDFRYNEPFKELIEQCYNYDVDITPLESVDFISVTPGLIDLWAVLSAKGDGIYLSNHIPQYLPTFKKFILLHEFGHFLDGAGHLDDGPYLRRKGKNINIEKIIRNYCEYEEEFLIYLRDRQK